MAGGAASKRVSDMPRLFTGYLHPLRCHGAPITKPKICLARLGHACSVRARPAGAGGG
jgi:hypothetical protein